jgi:hypothetical protein
MHLPVCAGKMTHKMPGGFTHVDIHACNVGQSKPPWQMYKTMLMLASKRSKVQV